MSLPGSCDLRPRLEAWGLPSRRQGERPTCSVFTVAAALEYAFAARTGAGARLSVEYLNWAGHRAADRSADGGFFSELWDGFQAYGICREEELPYRDILDPDLEVPPPLVHDARQLRDTGLELRWLKAWDAQTGLTDAQLGSIRATLAAGWPVCGGFRWPRQPRWEDEVLQLCAPDEVYDGHSVLLLGYRHDPRQPGGGVLLFRNSAGDARDGAMPCAYATAYMNDAACIRS